MIINEHDDTNCGVGGVTLDSAKGTFLNTTPTKDRSKSPLGPICLGSVFTICWLLSSPIAALHRLAVWVGLARVSRYLSNSPVGLYSTLRDIWLTRLVREPLKLFMKMPREPRNRLCHRDLSYAMVPATRRMVS